MNAMTAKIISVSNSCLDLLSMYPIPPAPPNNSAVKTTFQLTPKLVLRVAKA